MYLFHMSMSDVTQLLLFFQHIFSSCVVVGRDNFIILPTVRGNTQDKSNSKCMSSWTKPKKFLFLTKCYQRRRWNISPSTHLHTLHTSLNMLQALKEADGLHSYYRRGEMSSTPTSTFHPRPPHNNRSSSAYLLRNVFFVFCSCSVPVTRIVSVLVC